MSNSKITDVVRVGIDIAKEVFQVHAVDKHGRICMRKTVSRQKLLELTAQMPQCLIGMEACSGSNYWAKEFQKQGHRVGLMAAHRVKGYVSSGNKDDKIDAEAICEAVGRPNMKFVVCKHQEQLDIQALHRYRQQVSKQATAVANQIRGMLLEYGIAIPKGITNVLKRVPSILEDADNGLSSMLRNLLQEMHGELNEVENRITKITKTIEHVCQSNDICKRVCKIPGIGPITATALYASMGNGRQFKNGREAAAWLGMIPRHKGTGGKTFNGKLSKKGSRYIKMLTIQGGRSVLIAEQKKEKSKVVDLQKRRCGNIAAVACAHRNIRIAWALMARGEEYRPTILNKKVA